MGRRRGRRRGRRGSGRRCATAGCQRFAQPGRMLCVSHARTGDGRDLEAALGKMARQVEQAFAGGGEDDPAARAQAAARQERALATFRQRVEQGAYGALFEGRLRTVMAQAAAERGLAAEIGALRVVLARLLVDPKLDAATQARLVAQVSEAAVKASRVRWELAQWEEEPGRAETRRLMAELEGGGDWAG